MGVDNTKSLQTQPQPLPAAAHPLRLVPCAPRGTRRLEIRGTLGWVELTPAFDGLQPRFCLRFTAGEFLLPRCLQAAMGSNTSTPNFPPFTSSSSSFTHWPWCDMVWNVPWVAGSAVLAVSPPPLPAPSTPPRRSSSSQTSTLFNLLVSLAVSWGNTTAGTASGRRSSPRGVKCGAQVVLEGGTPPCSPAPKPWQPWGASAPMKQEQRTYL